MHFPVRAPPPFLSACCPQLCAGLRRLLGRDAFFPSLPVVCCERGRLHISADFLFEALMRSALGPQPPPPLPLSFSSRDEVRQEHATASSTTVNGRVLSSHRAVQNHAGQATGLMGTRG